MGHKIAVFYASVGTGHRSAAEALKEWCESEYPGSEVLCKDLLEYVPDWIKWSVTNSYLAMARSAPWAWERFYKSTDNPSRRDLFAAFWEDIHRSVSRMYVKHLVRDIDEFAPDAILVTHFFGMTALLDRWSHSTPVYFVNTDYLSHRLQRDPRFDGWFVGSEESARQHRADSIPTPNLTVMNFGIPISKKYLSPPDREESREKLGVESGAVMVLLAGGGIGAGALGEVADSMLDRTDWRVEVICGSNRKMMETLRDKYYPFKHISVRGFVENICHYYSASDAIVLKPGGLSSAESLAVGAALLLLDPLPGQEQYNCDYLLEKGAALRIFENRRTGERINELLESGENLERVRRRAKEISRPFAARDIISFVVDKIEEMASKKEPEAEQRTASEADRGGCE